MLKAIRVLRKGDQFRATDVFGSRYNKSLDGEIIDNQFCRKWVFWKRRGFQRFQVWTKMWKCCSQPLVSIGSGKRIIVGFSYLWPYLITVITRALYSLFRCPIEGKVLMNLSLQSYINTMMDTRLKSSEKKKKPKPKNENFSYSFYSCPRKSGNGGRGGPWKQSHVDLLQIWSLGGGA